MGGCIRSRDARRVAERVPNFYWLTRYRGEASHSGEARRQAAWVLMLWKGERRPRQVRLLEEEEEADEGEVFVDSWGDTQALAGEAQVQVLVMGDQGPSAWPAWHD